MRRVKCPPDVVSEAKQGQTGMNFGKLAGGTVRPLELANIDCFTLKAESWLAQLMGHKYAPTTRCCAAFGACIRGGTRSLTPCRQPPKGRVRL
jgi:hypothetical protein